jgi:LysM repeat protein
MEGGYLPWKNKSKEVVDELEAISKPLPPPPHGKKWERAEDGEWELKDVVVEPALPAVQSDVEEGSIIEHTVMPEDTLQGLCLKYGCSATDLRRLNMFSGSSIQCKKSLHIPTKRGLVIAPQEQTEAVVLQKFRNATGESLQEARLYLEDAGNDLQAALAAWKEDESWQDQQPKDVRKEERVDVDGEEDEESAVDSSLVQKKGVHVSRTERVGKSIGDSSGLVAPAAVLVPRVVAPACVLETEMVHLVPS